MIRRVVMRKRTEMTDDDPNEAYEVVPIELATWAA
jgi:hypothetical protein